MLLLGFISKFLKKFKHVYRYNLFKKRYKYGVACPLYISS